MDVFIRLEKFIRKQWSHRLKRRTNYIRTIDNNAIGYAKCLADMVVSKVINCIVALGELEGIKVNLTEDYNKYLTSLYGDYMSPPVKKSMTSFLYYNRCG